MEQAKRTRSKKSDQERPSNIFNMPQNEEMEECIIGCLLIESTAIMSVSKILTPEMFYNSVYKTIYTVIDDMNNRYERPDMVTVVQEIGKRGLVDEIGGAYRIVSISQKVSSAANVEQYAMIVKQLWIARKIAIFGMSISQKACDPTVDVDDVLSEMDKEVKAISDSAIEKDSVFSIGQAAQGALDEYYDSRNGDRKTISTGIKKMDDVLGGGVKENQLVVLAGRPGSGKAQSIEELVLTPSGFKRFGDLKIGDELSSVDCRKSFVNGIFPQGKKEVYEITFSDGRKAECCSEHLWEVHSDLWNEKFKVVTAAEIRSMLIDNKYAKRISIPVFNGNFGVKHKFTVSPYDYGELIARAYLKSTDSVLEWPKMNANTSSGANIPPCYKNALKQERIMLAKGLLKEKGIINSLGVVGVCVSIERLADDIVDLFRSLGFLASKKICLTQYVGGMKEYDVYMISISGQGLCSLFDDVARKSKVSRIKKDLHIVSVKPTGRYEEMMCISVTHNRHLYIVKDYVVTHNTSVLLHLASAAAREKKHALIFSLEMSGKELAGRMVVSVADVDSQDFRKGLLHASQESKLSPAVSTLAETTIDISDNANVTVNKIRSIAMEQQRKGRLDMVLIDYLQLIDMRQSNRSYGREQEVSQTSRACKMLAKELKVPVVLLSQLSRAVESRSDKRPMLSDLRESGAIEQDADVVIFVYRDEYYDDNAEKGLGELIVAKQRGGKTGIVPFSYNESLTRIGDYDGRGLDIMSIHQSMPIQQAAPDGMPF